jgi:hypothetical protein
MTKTKWQNEDIDKMLNFYLFSNFPQHRFQEELGRSWRSIKSILWKLAVRYDRSIVRDYVPGERFIRADQFSNQEKSIIALAHGETGVKNHAFELEYLAKILNRTQKEIRDYLEDLLKIHPPMFPPESDEEKASLIGHILRNFAWINLE